MPEYMTKSEPVDKKPYIVYTDEKGILYSDDPNADIPGGGGGGTEYNIKCATKQGGQPVEVEDCVGISIWNNAWEYASETSNKAQAGEVIKLTLAASYNMQLVGVFGTGDDAVIFPFDSEEGSFTMPKSDVYAIVQAL